MDDIMTNSMAMPKAALNDTGERMIPEASDDHTFWSHIYRYKFAIPLIGAKDVLDIACGEGYGAAALRAGGARRVLGVDIAPEACEHAQAKYGIETLVGECSAIPTCDESFDVVVSFETLEHLRNPDIFLAEIIRVLRPGGLLIISTPNAQVTNETNHQNDFHIQEYDRHGFLSLLSARFDSVALYYQYIYRCKSIGIRSLGAQHSPWSRIPGYWRMRLAVTRILCKHILEDPVPTQYSKNPIGQIIEPDHPISHAINPYIVKPWGQTGDIMPNFIIATARKPLP